MTGEQNQKPQWWQFWRRRSDPPPAPIDELIGESELVVGYAVAAGTLRDGTLFDKLAAVQSLTPDQRLWSNAAIKELRMALAQSRQEVPFVIVTAMRRGWRPQKDRLSEKAKNLTFILASLLLMFAVGYSTMTYNRGAQLLQDLSEMKERHPGLVFGRLERQIHLAERRLNQGKPDAKDDEETTADVDNVSKVAALSPTPVDSNSGDGKAADQDQADANAEAERTGLDLATVEAFLTQDASFQYVYDLSALDRELKLFEDQSDEFLRQADYQLYLPNAAYNSVAIRAQAVKAAACSWWIMGWLSCAQEAFVPPPPDRFSFLKGIVCRLGGAPIVDCSNPADDIAKRYELQYRSISTVDVKNFCRDIRYIEAAKKHGWATEQLLLIANRPDDARVDFLRSSNYLFDDALGIDTIDLMLQNCRLNLNYLSQSIPNIVDLQSKVSSRLATYSFIALPALYGALGSLMYFMRRIIDPLLPNPTLLRMISRVALGALAGMSLAWLWDGMFNTDDGLKSVGFGLFILAFVCGFAIDVFFTLLQQLVTLATAAVERIGSLQQQPAAQVPATPVPPPAAAIPPLPPGG